MFIKLITNYTNQTKLDFISDLKQKYIDSSVVINIDTPDKPFDWRSYPSNTIFILDQNNTDFDEQGILLAGHFLCDFYIFVDDIQNLQNIISNSKIIDLAEALPSGNLLAN